MQFADPMAALETSWPARCRRPAAGMPSALVAGSRIFWRGPGDLNLCMLLSRLRT